MHGDISLKMDGKDYYSVSFVSYKLLHKDTPFVVNS